MQPAFVQPHSAVSPFRGLGSSSLAHLVDQMAPTTLARLDAVSLLNRVDTKFLLTGSQVLSVLSSLAHDYLVLDIRGRRLHRYRTLYFDTPEFALYRQHHAGRAARHKVRSRLYVDTGLAFFEIKSKSRRRTVKHRLATPAFLTALTPDERAFATSHVSAAAWSLQPTLRNDFLRVTLVGKRAAERLTLDINLQFDGDGRTAVLPGIAIAELKQDDTDRDSPFLQTMSAAQLHPTSISKYCVGVGLLVADVEHDAFEEQLKTIESLTSTGNTWRATSVVDVMAAQQ